MSKKKKHQYFIIHKPYGMLSQFSPEYGKLCLSDLDFKFKKDVYPVGRLDQDSEGLLILTNDKRINNELLNPEKKHTKTYLVQVEGKVTDKHLEQLNLGIEISVKGKKHFTSPTIALKSAQPNWLTERNENPVKITKITDWLELTITEGKNRQVRKMTAAVGLPTLRLVRTAIENITIGNLNYGKTKELSKNTFFKKLNLNIE